MSFTLGNTSCQSQNEIHYGSGCIVVYGNESLNFNKARRTCLEGGGELATFEDDEDLNVFKSHHKHPVNSTYWIGLSRILWLSNILGTLKTTISVLWYRTCRACLLKKMLN